MKITSVVMFLLASCLFGCSTVSLDAVKRVSSATVMPLTSNEINASVEFTKVVVALERGTVYGQIGQGLGCFAGPLLKWEAGTASHIDGPLVQAARDVFKSAGIKLAGDPAQLFNLGPDSVGELVVAAKIQKIDLRFCGAGTYTGQKGIGYVEVEWQVLSRASGSVIMTYVNEGSFETKDYRPGGAPWITGAFTEASRHFVNASQFRTLLKMPKAPAAKV
jgi:hypothetical protein